MSNISKTRSRNLRVKGLANCFMVWLLVAAPAWAGYSPPTEHSAPRGSTTTTGRRSGDCQGNQAVSLTALAPQSHVGQTISTHPTFAWYVPAEEALPIEFYLYKFDQSGSQQLVYQAELQSLSGVMSVSLPETQPALEVGHRYHWQVVLLCNPNSPSSALVAEAEVEVVEPPEQLALSLEPVSDRVVRADVLAESGFWYDAIAQLTDRSDGNMRTAQLGLLIDLANIESVYGEGDRSAQLRQIIEAEQESTSHAP